MEASSGTSVERLPEAIKFAGSIHLPNSHELYQTSDPTDSRATEGQTEQAIIEIKAADNKEVVGFVLQNSVSEKQIKGLVYLKDTYIDPLIYLIATAKKHM